MPPDPASPSWRMPNDHVRALRGPAHLLRRRHVRANGGRHGARRRRRGEDGGDSPVSRLAEEDELLGALQAAVVTQDASGVGRDMTQCGDEPGTAVRANAVVGLG
jgi:hypothetical protein